MKKLGYAIHRLGMEYKALHKPSGHELSIETVKITGCAFIGAAVLKLIDTGFGMLLGFIL